MERKEAMLKTGCSRTLWAVMAVLLCAIPCIAYTGILPVDTDAIVNLGTDYGPEYVGVDSGSAEVDGTLNMYPGAYVDWGINAYASSTVNIRGGTIPAPYWVTVFNVGGGTAATVTVYGTDFTVSNGTIYSDPSGTWFTVNDPSLFVVLTGTYGEYQGAPGGPINLSFSVASNIPIFLAAPGSGEPEPEPIIVQIDIKPGSYPNAINLGANGVIPVAILSSDTFDATTVDPETVSLAGLAGVAVRGKGSKLLASEEDVNGDGLPDLVVKIDTENFAPGDLQSGSVLVTGKTFEGQDIEGQDDIVIVPPE